MITTKQQRCARFVWAYITRYGPLAASEIPQGTYSRAEIDRAIDDLESGGQVDWNNAGYYALIPFVMDIPAWAR